MDYKKELLGFMGRYLNLNKISDRTDFINEGLVSSMFAMQLVIFLEENFNIVVKNEDMQLQNFSSINAIEQFIERNVQSEE